MFRWPADIKPPAGHYENLPPVSKRWANIGPTSTVATVGPTLPPPTKMTLGRSLLPTDYRLAQHMCTGVLSGSLHDTLDLLYSLQSSSRVDQLAWCLSRLLHSGSHSQHPVLAHTHRLLHFQTSVIAKTERRPELVHVCTCIVNQIHFIHRAYYMSSDKKRFHIDNGIRWSKHTCMMAHAGSAMVRIQYKSTWIDDEVMAGIYIPEKYLPPRMTLLSSHARRTIDYIPYRTCTCLMDRRNLYLRGRTKVYDIVTLSYDIVIGLPPNIICYTFGTSFNRLWSRVQSYCVKYNTSWR